MSNVSKVEVPREEILVDVKGVELDAVLTTQTKGPKRGQPIIVVTPALDDPKFFEKLAAAVGLQNLIRTFNNEFLKGACYTASEEATNEDGVIEQSKYGDAFAQEFLEKSRKTGGATAADLREKRLELGEELEPYYKQMLDGSITDEGKLAMMRLLSEISAISESLEKKSRTKKAKAGATSESGVSLTPAGDVNTVHTNEPAH